MKTNFLFLGILTFALLFERDFVIAQNAQNIKAKKVWKKVINYYDPEGIWDKYRGEMHMYVISPGERPGEEDLIIDNAKNLYQCVFTYNDEVQVLGIENDQVFYRIGDKRYTEEDQLPETANFRLTEEWARKFYEHHKMHFSVPLFLKERGAVPKKQVSIESFEGKDVYVLEFDEIPNAFNRGFFRGPVKLFIDVDNYLLRKAFFDMGVEGGRTVVHRKEMNLNGIIVPRIREYFDGKGKYMHLDVFYPYTAYDYQDDGQVVVQK